MQLAKRLVFMTAMIGWATGRVWAQDPLTAAPEMYKLLFENDRVRVLEVTFQPGQKIAPHSHPDHFAYVVEAGKLRISKPDGSSMDADLQASQVLWIPAETHWAENTGTSVVRLMVTELKDTKPHEHGADDQSSDTQGADDKSSDAKPAAAGP